MELIHEIDNQGYLLQDIVIDKTAENVNYPEYYTKVPFPRDEEGNQLPFYKPRFDGKKWVETLSQAEIDEIQNVPRRPSEIELLENRTQATEDAILLLMMEGVI